MRRSLGFQQQCYADDGMWMDTQAQQQQSYAHEESWSSDNNSYHKQQFPGMHMKKPGANFDMESELSMSKHHGNKLGGNYGMFHESMPNGHHGYMPNNGHHHGYGNYMHGGGKKLRGINPSHQFSNGGAKFNSGGHHGYSSEESCEEYEDYSEEHHHGAAKVKMDEMRYERHNWGGDHAFYANPHDHRNMNMNWKTHGAGHKVEWIAKGV